MSSNTCCARAFSTGTAARSRPSTSRAKPLTTWPGASGNWSLPSRMRLLGLKKTICTRVSAAPPATSTSTCSEASRTGCSAPCTCSIGARQVETGGVTETGNGAEIGGAVWAKARAPVMQAAPTTARACRRAARKRTMDGMARSPDAAAHERAAGQRVKRGGVRFGVKAADERRKRKMRDPDGPRMNVLRFADLVAAGQAAQRRVFIRADLNVPQDHSPEAAAASPKTPGSAPRCRASRWRSAPARR